MVMKKIIQLFFLCFFFVGLNLAFGQNTQSYKKMDDKCKVIHNELSGKYIGKCKNGLADGKGNFLFANGKFIYIGYFKNGKMHGKGEIFMIENGVKSKVKEGTWIENNLVENLKSYEVIKTVNLDRYTIKKVGEGNKVNLNFYQNGGRNKVKSLNIYSNNGTEISGSLTRGFENIDFPFKCEIDYYTSNKFKSVTYSVRFEFIINEPGEWEVTLYN